MINAQHLSFGFPDKNLYHNISFSLDSGDHCALIGSNGTGKSTLVDLIRRPEHYLYDGTLSVENVGRIGFVSQFAAREQNQDQTVFDFLSEDFLLLQEQISELCSQMSNSDNLDLLLEQYQNLLDESESMDADNYEVNIRRQLHLAQLNDKADLSLSKLSGGEYKLIQIIRQMLCRPGLLIMDEPDVFLDFENLNGLRDLINSYEGTMLVITHNRYILAHCFDRIWHLEGTDLQEFDGNYTEYNFALLKKKVDLMEASAAGLAEIQRATEMVERLRKEATEVIDPLRGRTLKQKASYLERVKAWHIKPPFVEIRQPEISLPVVAPDKSSTVLLQVDNYELSFNGNLLNNVNFQVHAHEKIAIVGPNGTGKTSLLRDICANDNPSILFHETAIPAFFSQLQEETLNEKNTIYQEFYDIGFDSPSIVEEYLTKYCFDPNTLDRKISQLSGGEKNLLQLAKLCASQSNLLLLDEPSSHLDTYAQIALENALAAYQGAVLMVSHDFYHIANCADSILYVENGSIRPMSSRAFRKMVYKHYFNKEYLELEQKKKEYETRIARLLESGNWVDARPLLDELALVIERM